MNEPKCKHCQHSEFDPRCSLPILWCALHRGQAIEACVQFSREPGTEGDE